MQSKFDFLEKKEVEGRGMEELKCFLRKSPTVLEIVDTSNIKDYWKMGVDLIIKYQKKENLIEVKVEQSSQTGNFYIETISNNTKRSQGWLYTTQSNYIYYYFLDTKELHVLHVEKFREWFNNNMNRFPAVSVKTHVGTGFYYSIGKLVNRDLVKSELDIKKLIVRV